MVVGFFGSDASARRPREESFLQEIRLADILERNALFADAGGEGIQADRAAFVLLHDGQELVTVKFVESGFVDFQTIKGVARDLCIDDALSFYLSKIAHAVE